MFGPVSSNPTPRVITGDCGESVWWSGGSLITVKVGADDSAGALSLAHQLCPPGYETPEHVHRSHDELLVAERGTVSIHYGDEVLHADLGDAVYLPKGAPHGFRVGEDGGGLYILFEPGLEKGFLEAGVPADVPADELPEPPAEVIESERLGSFPDEYDTDVLGPLPGGA